MKAAPASIDRHLLMMGLAAAVLAGASQVRVAVAGEGKVVFADDFGTPSAQNPPANRAMWGAQQDRVPANYTRDTAQRHEGRAPLKPPSSRQTSQPRLLTRTPPGMEPSLRTPCAARACRQ